MDKKQVFGSTITNLAYIMGGAALVYESPALLVPGVYSMILGVFSGIHHYHLHNHKVNDFTRRLDYLGMYLVFSAIPLMLLGWDNGMLALISACLSLGLVIVVGPARWLVGTFGGAAWVAAIITSGLGAGLETAAWAAVAFSFNRVGLQEHPHSEDFFHGVGWHVPTAYMIYLLGMFIL